jgi:hypothetical protein
METFAKLFEHFLVFVSLFRPHRHPGGPAC